jgi:hypothetical protein
VIETPGAPYDQGWKQGAVLAEDVRTEVASLRAAAGCISWRSRLHAAHRGPARRVRRFLPQHHERLCGLAEAARVPLAALELLVASRRVAVSGGMRAGRLEARIDSDDIRDRLLLRRTVPDAGGFASVELTAAPWAGCLAGVNAEGLAVLCERDEAGEAPTCRLLAQELLLRARGLDAARDHARRRGRYLGGVWSLLVLDAAGQALRVSCDDGGIRSSELAAGEPSLEGVVLTLEPSARRLVMTGFGDSGEGERVVELSPLPRVEPCGHAN